MDISSSNIFNVDEVNDVISLLLDKYNEKS